jgi:hypothetical protein
VPSARARVGRRVENVLQVRVTEKRRRGTKKEEGREYEYEGVFICKTTCVNTFQKE